MAIARALVNQPSLLFADEPTGNLDTRTGLEIIDIIQRLNREGLTVLMVTHEPEIASFASRTITLRDGLIVSERTTPRSAAQTLADMRDEEEVETAVAGLAVAEGGH